MLKYNCRKRFLVYALYNCARAKIVLKSAKRHYWSEMMNYIYLKRSLRYMQKKLIPQAGNRQRQGHF
jgi:hypothetical protein